MNHLSVSKHTLKLLLLFLTLIGGIYASHAYLISPLLLKKEHLEQSTQDLDTQLQDITSLETQLKSLQNQVAEKEANLQDKPKTPQYTALSYVDFISYVGELEKDSGAKLVAVREDAYLPAGDYYEIPYELEVAGNYVELLKFTNGLSDIDGLLVWTSVNLTRGSSVLTSDKDLLLSTDWATQIKDMLGATYPTEAPPTPSEEGSQTEDTLPSQDTVTTPPPSKQDKGVLHLDLTFKLITVENPRMVGER